MDYKQKYEQACELAKTLRNLAIETSHENTRMVIEELFPELKESEDEKIMKDIIAYMRYERKSTEEEIENRFIPWLEKQGEQNPKHFELKAGHWYICHRAYCCRADNLTVKEGERFMCKKDGVVKGFVVKEPEKYFKEVCAPAPIELEQKPVDKVEPKFNVGDWIVEPRKDEPDYLWHFDRIKNDCYWYDAISAGVKIAYANKECHLWTIQDAKDGDVLVCSAQCHWEKIEQVGIYKEYIGRHGGCSHSFKIYAGIDWDQHFLIDNTMGSSEIYPATKEQRDQLFQKIHEAGYEWDAEKKELKKE